MLTELEDRLSVVPRWTIVRTIQKQSVAEHQFRVALIADRIARDWFEIVDPRSLYHINHYALRHDDTEAITGDVPAIVNDLMDHNAVRIRYADMITVHTMPPHLANWARIIVKIADCIEALLFLNTERLMGNKMVTPVYTDVFDNFHAALVKAGRSDDWVNDRVSEFYTWIGHKLTAVNPANRRPR